MTAPVDEGDADDVADFLSEPGGELQPTEAGSQHHDMHRPTIPSRRLEAEPPSGTSHPEEFGAWVVPAGLEPATSSL
jgi:hypothetical protein